MIVWCIMAFILVQSVHGTQPMSTQYRIYDMIPQGICQMRRIPFLDNFLTKSDPIQLTSAESGAIFQQTWNSSSFKKYSDCKFYLQAPPGMGLYLTVSKVQLRKNSRDHCLDSIVIKKSIQFCDAQNAEKPRVFSDDRGWMKVKINLDTTLPLPSLDDTLEVQFIVTVKRNCDKSEYEPCDPDDDDSCIHKTFFGDGFVNCPECVDEAGCARKDTEQVQMLNTSNIFITALTFFFATMLVAGGCIWCLYKYRHCVANCNSNSAGTARSNRNPVATDQIHVELHTSANDIRPTAPPDDDKDLPPSYDSLFSVEHTAR